MKKFALVGGAVALFAIPAAANAQAYVQLTGGLDSVAVDGGSSEGVAYGIAAGYDVPVREALFVGIEASAADSTTKQCESSYTDGTLDYKGCVKSGRDLAVVARLGTNVGDMTKLYLLAGYTNARAKLTYEEPGLSISDGTNLDGFRLGAGFEHDFGGNLFGKVEYRYSNYESGFTRHNALVGLGVKF